jgi:hypothetical protein
MTTMTNVSNGMNLMTVSERDYISKIALLARTSKDTPVREIARYIADGRETTYMLFRVEGPSVIVQEFCGRPQ